MKFSSDGMPSRQVSREFEDLVQLHHLVVGGAVRYDTTTADGTRNTVYARGTAQLHLKKMNAYTTVEVGRDMVNRSVFTTNAVNSTIIVGVLDSGWQMD